MGDAPPGRGLDARGGCLRAPSLNGHPRKRRAPTLNRFDVHIERFSASIPLILRIGPATEFGDSLRRLKIATWQSYRSWA